MSIKQNKGRHYPIMSEKRVIQISQPLTGEAEWLALKAPLDSGWLTQGPQVNSFEQRFAQKHGVKHAIATTSCTTALHLILSALEIGPGDEVILPAFTWIATANVVMYCGATPIFADILPDTFNLDPDQVKAKINARTRAIIPVHLFGLCAEMSQLKEIAGSIPLIEDAACAAGSFYKNTPAGSLGLAGAFSFHPRKTITTGEGGMITTQDSDLAEKMNQLRNHGASVSEEQRHHGPRPYLLPEFNLLGYNYRMTDLQAAVGLVQLEKLDQFIQERHYWANWYQEQLQDLPWLHLPSAPSHSTHSWQAFVCKVDENKVSLSRNEIMEQLQQKGISTRPGTHALHMLGLYREKYGFKPEDYPIARDCDRFSMAIPLHNRMTAEDFAWVAACLKAIK
jgi:perosamine synthetase